MAALDRLHDHEIEVSEKEMRRRLDAAEGKILDSLAAATREGGEGGGGGGGDARINTRSLRSKETKDDDRNPRRSPFGRAKGPATAASLLLDQGLTEAEILDDFFAIATEHNKVVSQKAA